ncbi:hypothetical protein GCM10011376_34760 [Nocardioides flavus (ex Wang et al. 2016)]|uniref:Uncharacterized protein n=1 Tax=Nocardioides flavus (ex Wang et al. 2016) TaxID=2058780 RepID=A0ABQ3HMT6_9ACTN|nr:hypothetical protein [Nocardioides flavus (ex Wang et al. 2016)]GHE18866.1 hypothetical protein GCM10011376_34760 [Nocardioides flavus (ex Wang et al. 2016)]
MSQINRRTVVRGAAWTVPVVAVASTAPAFAASTTPPAVSGFTGCKTPGDPNGPNCQGYRLNATMTVDAPYTWTVVLQQVKIDGADVTSSLQPTNTYTVSSSNPVVSFRICTDKSPGQISVQLVYSVSRTGVPPVTLTAPAMVVKLNPC